MGLVCPQGNPMTTGKSCPCSVSPIARPSSSIWSSWKGQPNTIPSAPSNIPARFIDRSSSAAFTME